MESAFGVEHTEITKALKMPKMGSMRPLRSTSHSVKYTGDSKIKSTMKSGSMFAKPKVTAQSTTNGFTSAPVSIGGGLTRTGKAAIAGGVGATGTYGMNRQKRY